MEISGRWRAIVCNIEEFDEKIAKTVFGFSILDIYFCPFFKT